MHALLLDEGFLLHPHVLFYLDETRVFVPAKVLQKDIEGRARRTPAACTPRTNSSFHLAPAISCIPAHNMMQSRITTSQQKTHLETAVKPVSPPSYELLHCDIVKLVKLRRGMMRCNFPRFLVPEPASQNMNTLREEKGYGGGVAYTLNNISKLLSSLKSA